MRIREEKDMQNKILRKGLVIGIIILFVGVGILSSVSSKDISFSDDKIIEDNDEIEPIDNYDEIISFINGGGYIDWDDGCSGFIQHDFYVFSADIFIKAFTKNPLKPFYTATANEIHMDLYIGGIGCGPASPGELKCYLIGVAIGDIEWS
jgi:hypothetical protein